MIKRVAILGAGTMGCGIAAFFAEKGISTILYDPYQDALHVCREKQGKALNLIYTSDLRTAVKDADLVIESAPEDLMIKKQLYSDISKVLKQNAIVASNTSTFPLADLSDGQPFAGRMVIAHFFNPGHIIPLVEIVQLEHTEPGIAETIAAFLRSHGKAPVILKKDIAGFIANRLQAAVLREACYLVEQQIAEPADIDTIMKESIGIRWALNGPFEIADFGGLDIWEKVLKNLMPVLNNSTEVPALISQKVSQQNLGLKSGKGFYTHRVSNGADLAQNRTEMLRNIVKIKTADNGDATG